MSGNKDPLDVVQLFIDKNKDSFGQIGFGGGRLWLRFFHSIIREALILMHEIFSLTLVLIHAHGNSSISHGVLLWHGFP